MSGVKAMPSGLAHPDRGLRSLGFFVVPDANQEDLFPWSCPTFAMSDIDKADLQSASLTRDDIPVSSCRMISWLP